jgi:uncharacterized radical SAM superfamily protein
MAVDYTLSLSAQDIPTLLGEFDTNRPTDTDENSQHFNLVRDTVQELVRRGAVPTPNGEVLFDVDVDAGDADANTLTITLVSS